MIELLNTNAFCISFIVCLVTDAVNMKLDRHIDTNILEHFYNDELTIYEKLSEEERNEFNRNIENTANRIKWQIKHDRFKNHKISLKRDSVNSKNMNFLKEFNDIADDVDIAVISNLNLIKKDFSKYLVEKGQ